MIAAKWFFKYLLQVTTTAFLATICSSQNCLRTNKEGPHKLAPCVFPFTYKDIVYHACTNASDPGGKIWCSTNVDESGNHVGGRSEWGYCDPDCQTFDDLLTTVNPLESKGELET
jgi:hypothetical protein